MLYNYNKETLLFEKDNKIKLKLIGLISSIIISIIIIIILCINNYNYNEINLRKELIIDSLIIESNISKARIESYKNSLLIVTDKEFSEDKMAKILIDLNIKFPDIVMAQARYESANFSSNIWEKNNNPFGMKVANSRPTINIGQRNGHAEYKNWVDAIIDYAMWQASYARKFKTRSEYFNYLKRVYAEGPYSSIHTITKNVQKDYPELYVENWPAREN